MSSNELAFPLWVLIYRGEMVWRPVMLTPGLAAAFSNHTRAGDFLQAANNPAWEVRLVVRVTWSALLVNFRQHGATGVALDPNTDGGGTPFTFSDVEVV
jgi:hypothetical protein